MSVKPDLSSTGDLSTTATDGDDFIDLGPGNTARVDGMGGFDTVLLRPTEQSNHFGIYIPDYFKNIEVIQGSTADEQVSIDARILRSLQIFDGGGGNDEILLHNLLGNLPGNTLDLSQTKVVNATLDLDYLPSDLPVTVKVGYRETALAIHTQSESRVTVDASESGITFTLAERNEMFANGVDTILDASGSYNYTPVTLTDFEDTRIVRPGQGPIFLDENQDAGVVFTPGGGSLELETWFGELGLDEGGTVDLVEDGAVTWVRVDLTDDGVANGLDIGTLTVSATSGIWRFQFNEEASGEHIKEVLRNLTFTFDDTIPGGGVFDTGVTLKFQDAVSWAETFSTRLFLVPTNAQVLDPAQNSSPATEGDDEFVASAAIFRNNYTLAGGDGTDTLYLDDPGSIIQLWNLAEFSGIERIVFHQYGGFLQLTAQNLASVDTIVGGGAGAWADISLVGAARSIFDLSNKTLAGAYYLTVESAEDGDIVITDKSQVLEYVGSFVGSRIFGDQRSGLRLHLVGDTFTAEERQALRDGGMSFVRDASDDGAGNLVPVLHNLDGDHIQARNGDAVALDLDGNGSITDDGGIRKLTVTIVGGDANDRLGISTAGSIRLLSGMIEGGEIRDVTIPLGIVFARLYDISNTSFTILFNGNATQAHIDNLIHALTYANVGWGPGTRQREIAISVSDGADKTTTGTVTVTHTTDVQVLDPAGTSAPSTGGDDDFIAPIGIFRGDYSLNGGAGTDTLYLTESEAEFDFTDIAEFSGFERILFHETGGLLRLNDAGFAQVDAIAGATDGSGIGDIILDGAPRATFDLRGKAFTEAYAITVAASYADLVVADKSQILSCLHSLPRFGLRVKLVGDAFTETERAQLIERGVAHIWDESDNGAGNLAPVIAGLDGDHVQARNGDAMALDLGADAMLSDDGKIRKITVTVVNGDANDKLGISTSGSIILTGGLVEGGEIRDGLVPLATLFNVTNTSFEILINGQAFPSRIDALVRALTYANTGDAAETQRQIRIDVSDSADKTSTATVTVTHTASQQPPPTEPVAPSSLALSNSTVRENTPAGSQIGKLSAVDPDTGDRLTYTLLDDAGGRFAISGDRIVVADSLKLDYEQAQAHAIRVRVTDNHGLSAEKSFTIAVQDVVSETVAGSAGHDVIKGGLGRDVLTGGAGNDQIWGGLDKDVLRGGAGKDVFVFDYRANKAHADRVMDFNVRDDSIYLENKVFKKLGKMGSLDKPAKLASKFFKIGTKAADRDDYLIYNKKTGKLYYDGDGSGMKIKAVEIATLSDKPKLKHTDFFVV